MRATACTVRFGVAALVLLACVGVACAPGPAFAAAERKNDVTFAKDVAPIFQQKCQECHRPGTGAPMSLMTYAEARPWARSIRNRVALREMPPWHLDKTIGIQAYKNDRSLTDDEIATIVAWVEAGAPLGNPQELPPPVSFAAEDEWSIGKPEVIIKSPEHLQSANGPDWWGSYESATELTEDRYIKAVQTRPSQEGRRITHHVIVSIVQPGARDGEGAISVVQARAERGGSGGVVPGAALRGESLFSDYFPGKAGDMFPEGTGRLIRAGSRLKFGVHFISVGEEVRGQLEVGIVFYPKGVVPTYRVDNMSVGDQQDLDIPPGAVIRLDAHYRLPKPARILSFQPHMHMRGRYSCLEAIHLDSNPLRQTTPGVMAHEPEMLSCANFDFNWQLVYTYEDDVAPLLPAGTILRTISILDNSASNPRNPDPSVWVGLGQRSVDEMATVHFDAVFLTDEDYARAVAERLAKRQEAKKK